MTRLQSKKALFNYTKNLVNLIDPKKVSFEMEEKKRTIEDVKSEFVNVCARAGNAAFTKAQLEKEIEVLQKRMSELNAEATELSKEQASNEQA